MPWMSTGGENANRTRVDGAATAELDEHTAAAVSSSAALTLITARPEARQARRRGRAEAEAELRCGLARPKPACAPGQRGGQRRPAVSSCAGPHGVQAQALSMVDLGKKWKMGRI